MAMSLHYQLRGLEMKMVAQIYTYEVTLAVDHKEFRNEDDGHELTSATEQSITKGDDHHELTSATEETIEINGSFNDENSNADSSDTDSEMDCSQRDSDNMELN